ncbi:hypothetical protein HYW87_01185 [Candidatus Roizmanbacteria bacterium]|nr:hypothetical protein [Candidatus Roizmanbacteria bacterium]
MSSFSLVGLAIESLLVTNFFVFVYSNVLRLLNSVFPAKDPIEFIRIGALPEPFEILLYLALSFSSVVGLVFFHRFFFKNSSTSIELPIAKYLIFIFLLFLLISNLGTYPMARSTYPYQKPETSATYTLHLFFFLLITTSVTFLVYILRNRIERNAKKIFLFLIFIVTVIAIATFEPRFPIVGHDYSYFFGPIWEVVHGKTLYTEVPSQYGFLSILLFSFFYKIGLLNITYLPLVVWLFYIVAYFLSFFLIYKISQSLPLALIGLFSIITVNYFSIYHLPGTIPQTGPLRWLPAVLLLFSLYKLKNIASIGFIILLSIMSLWVLDSGISLILAFGFTLFILFLTGTLSIKRFARSLITLAGSLVGLLLGINLIHIVLGYKPIDIISVFVKLQQYASSGFGMLPLDLQTYFWVVLLIYFASIIYILRNKFQESSQVLLLFSANISLFASVYFVGRSHPHNLFHISLLPLLNGFILLGLLLKHLNQSSILRFMFYVSCFTIFIAYPIYNRQEVMTKIVKAKINRFKTGNIFIPEWFPFLQKKYQKEVGLIKEYLPEKEILILSPDDTYLFYLTGKENIINDNSQITILTQKDLDFSLARFYKTCPRRVVADCTLFKKCESSKPFTEIAFFSIQPILLNRIQEMCKVAYR